MKRSQVAISIVSKENLDLSQLPASEIAQAKKLSHARRQQSFLLGRMAAHLALETLTPKVKHSISISKSKAPNWPKNITGSISHCEDLAVSVVTTKDNFLSLGVDIELISRFKHKALAKRICTSSEAAWALKAKKNWPLRLAMIFSAKEAVYKALNPLTNRYIGFKEAEIVFSDAGQFKVKLFNPMLANQTVKGEIITSSTHTLAIVAVR
jgi:enterobactin synthetase component D